MYLKAECIFRKLEACQICQLTASLSYTHQLQAELIPARKRTQSNVNSSSIMNVYSVYLCAVEDVVCLSVK